MSAAVLVLAGALKVISTIGSENLLTSVLALGTVMVELTAVAFILSKDSGRFMKGAAGTIAFAAGIRVLASAVKAFGGLKTDQLVKGLVGAGVVCAELVATAKLLDGVKFGIGKGTGFVLVAASMEILQNAVQKFGEMDTENLAKGLVAVGAALLEFVTALNFSKGSLGSAISLTIMAGAINLLVPVQDLSCDGRKRHRNRIVQPRQGVTHPQRITEDFKMDKKVSTATIVRTICLALALINQLLSAGGHSVIPIDNETVNQLVTTIITVVVALVNWWENNSFTPEAIRADELLDQMQGKSSK